MLKKTPGFFLIILLFCSEVYSQEIPKWKITDLEKHIKEARGPLIVNFWATYCVPCIEEIPYFQELTQKYRDQGVELLLVSLDFEEFYPARIRRFADKQNFTAPIVWLDETNADYFCPRIDVKWSGVMPATLMVNQATGYRSFFEEEISKEELEKKIVEMISPGTNTPGTQPYIPVDPILYNKIAELDSLLFDSYNNCSTRLEEHASYFSDDIEFYHDQGGLITSRKDLIEGTRRNICGKVTRTLVKGSLEVYPIKNYGAVEIGYHSFQNNQDPPGTISKPGKFIIIWKNTDDQWKITRVVSLH